MIVDAVRNGYLQARFDHKNNTVHFGGQVGDASGLPRCRWGRRRAAAAPPRARRCLRGPGPRGPAAPPWCWVPCAFPTPWPPRLRAPPPTPPPAPLVQEVESERVRGHIAAMAKRLTRALAMIDAAPAGTPAWRQSGRSAAQRGAGPGLPCPAGGAPRRVAGAWRGPSPCVPALPPCLPALPAAEKEARRSRLVALALDTSEKENKRMVARKVRAGCGW